MSSQYHTSHNFEEFDKVALNRAPFNRKIFDPLNASDGQSLNTLRTQGRTRAYNYQSYHPYSSKHSINDPVRCCGSSALKNLNLTRAKRGDIFLDLGCGDSPDALIAKKLGYMAFGLDLFESTLTTQVFIKRDIVEDWPESQDGKIAVVNCQAMIDLVAPDERERLYRNVFKGLRPDGLFSLYGINLHCGYGFNAHVEIQRIRAIGFRAVDVKPSGFVVIK